MRIMETKVYPFDELSEAAQKKALEACRDFQVEDRWYDFTYEYITEILEILGFSEVKISFSGFWSQGDGASFTGKYTYNPEWEKALLAYAPTDTKWKEFGTALECLAKKLLKHAKGSLQAEISRGDHRYSHENTGSYYVWSSEDMYADIPDGIEGSFMDTCKNMMRYIYSTLEEEYTYLTSDDVVKETILANEYEFTEGGKLI